MEFWDRESEMEFLKEYLENEPNSVMIIYGPRSSGKTTLVSKLAEKVAKDYKFYWYDLREEPVSGYESVLRVFFKERGWAERVVSTVRINLGVIELDPRDLKKIFSKEENPFTYMRKQLERDLNDGFKPVVVFDEVQRLKGIYVNSSNNQRSLIDELFNFFVRLTKVLHLSHVFIMSSDSFFIEEIFIGSSLTNSAEFFLVDFFEEDEVLEILKEHGIDEEVARDIVEWIGGVPWMIERVLSSRDPLRKVRDLYKLVKGMVREALVKLGPSDELFEILEGALVGRINPMLVNREILEKLVTFEVLFYDPLEGEVSFQSPLHRRAVEEIIEERRGGS